MDAAVVAAYGRIADHPIHSLCLECWSPRAFTGEPIGPATQHTLFKASQTFMDLPGATAPMPLSTLSLNAGAAWGALALEAAILGWQAHGMAGFDRSRAIATLHVLRGSTWRRSAGPVRRRCFRDDCVHAKLRANADRWRNW